jgi:hypothetical protein
MLQQEDESSTRKDVIATEQYRLVLGSSPRRRRREREAAAVVAVVLFKKSLAVSPVTLLRLLFLGIILSAFCVYAFHQPSSPSNTIMMRRRGSLYHNHRHWFEQANKFTKSHASRTSRLQEIRHDDARTRRCRDSSIRLYASVADTMRTTTSMKTKTKAALAAADIEKNTAVELKYMEYVPHLADSSSAQAHVPIVFLHGLLGNKKNFATIATSLGHQLKKKRRIIGLDLRNHGTVYVLAVCSTTKCTSIFILEQFAHSLLSSFHALCHS